MTRRAGRHRARLVLSLVAGAAAVAIATADLFGYAFLEAGDKWPDGNIVMQEQLGPGSGTLKDGSTSWNAAFEAGLAIWNTSILRVTFTAVRDSIAAIGDGNGVNNVIFSDTIYGRAFGSNVLAVTTNWLLGSTRVEADIVFNNAVPWNSYRGKLVPTSDNLHYLNDIRRVGLHESGHVLGLDHPDDHGQTVTAQMNSHEGDLDSLAADDIAGAGALYGATTTGTGAVINFPPRNESFDFRVQLEAKYRDGLHRPSQPTYVDNEGDVVWTQEYLRYRVNQCSHVTAVTLVMSEIDGAATPPVCGSAPGGQVNFPPRNESLDFRTQLEAKYRDGLRRSPSFTSVDQEGDSVWTQEYLRYRVNGCTHGDAVTKVLQQIDGLGIQPLCR